MVAARTSSLIGGRVNDPWGANGHARLLELADNDDPAYRALTNRALEYLRGTVPPPANVLDAGSGLGFLSVAMESAGYDVTAIDPSEGSIELSRRTHKKFRGKFLNQSMYEFALNPRSASSFDAVVANMTLHSVEKLQTFFASASVVLKPDGILYASIPNPRTYLQSRADVDINSRNLSEPQHFQLAFRIRNHDVHPQLVDFYHYPLKTYTSLARTAGLYLADFDVPEQIGAGRARDIMILVFKPL